MALRNASLANPDRGNDRFTEDMYLFPDDNIDLTGFSFNRTGRENTEELYRLSNKLNSEVDRDKQIVYEFNYKKGSLGIEAVKNSTDFQALISVSRFHTNGTKAGQWHIPSLEEEMKMNETARTVTRINSDTPVPHTTYRISSSIENNSFTIYMNIVISENNETTKFFATSKATLLPVCELE